MNQEGAAIVAGVAGILLSLGMALPQAWRIWCDGSAIGVSGLSWSLFCLTFSLWLGYGAREGNHVVLASNVFSLITAAVLLVGVSRARRTGYAPWMAAMLAAAAVLTAVVGLRAPIALVTALASLGALVRAPQVYESWGTFRRAWPSEVSMATWWVSLASGVLWSIHGALRPDGTVLIASMGVLILSAAVLALERGAARRRGDHRSSWPRVLRTNQTNG